MNAIPFFGWAVSAFVAISVSVPFWLCWTWVGIGEKYFYFLPEMYHNPPFMDCVAFFIVATILQRLVPKFVSVSQVNTDSK